jgi:hypothetical protein
MRETNGKEMVFSVTREITLLQSHVFPAIDSAKVKESSQETWGMLRGKGPVTLTW